MSVISGTVGYTVGSSISLSSSGTYTSPLIITSTGDVGAPITGDKSSTWEVENAGTIARTGFGGGGISFAGNGIVLNTGTIGAAVNIGGNGNINNSGTTAYLIIGGVGSVTNSGTVNGNVTINGGGTVQNSGSIKGGIVSGVGGYLNNTGNAGTIIFETTGTISNQQGAYLQGILGPFAPMTNFGSIGSVDADSGVFTNAQGASVNLLDFNGPATLVNNGIVTNEVITEGGTFTNGSGGRLYGEADLGNAVGTVLNYGTITNSLTNANSSGQVLLFAGGAILNGQSARIDGQVLSFGSATVINYGTVTEDGIALFGGGSVANGSAGETGAKVLGGSYGIETFGSVRTDVTNFGTVAASNGVYLAGAASFFTNKAGAAVSGSGAGVAVERGGTATVINYGSIGGLGSGVGVLISGTSVATVINYGTISGVGTSGTAIRLSGAATLQLTEGTAASLLGTVDGGGQGTLVLAGTKLDDLMGSVTGFAQITDLSAVDGALAGNDTIPTGGTLTDSGTLAVYGTLTNNGATNVTGTLSVAGTMIANGTITGDLTISGSGTTQNGGTLQTGGTLEIGGSVGASGTVTFSGTLPGTLVLDQPQNFGGVISGMVPFDVIDLPNVPYTSGTKALGYAVETAGNMLSINAANGATYQLQLTPGMNPLLGFSGEGFIVAPDKTGGTEVVMVPTLALAQLSADAYNITPVGISGWFPIDTITNGEAQATAYINQDSSQIVVAIRGTNFGSGNNWVGFKNLLTDVASFPTGDPTPGMQAIVTAGAQLLSQIANQFPKANITLTGHSLGGGAAELLGAVSGYNTVVFNAPGPAALATALQPELAPAAALKGRNPQGGAILEIRVPGDIVSLFGIQEGSVQSISAAGLSDIALNVLNNHLLTSGVLPDLEDPFAQLQPGVVEASSALLNVVDVANGTSTNIVGGVFTTTVFGVDVASNYWVDPSSGNKFAFTEQSGSPPIQSVTFPGDPADGVVAFDVSYMLGGAWTPPQLVTAGTMLSFGSGTTGFEYEGLSSSGQVVSLSDGFMFDVTFASAGNFSGGVADTDITSVATAAALSGQGVTDTLMTNAAGALVLDEVSGDPSMTYAQIGGLGPEWQFEGTGSFLGDGNLGFLLWSNASGAIVVGEDANGQSQYTQIGAVGPEWQFEGNGAFLGQSTDDFLLWSGVSGALVVGAVSGGSAQYAQIGGLGMEWQFEGTGDYLGDGNTGFLIENANSGALVVGEDVGGSAQYIQIGGLGPEWMFEGSGDLLGLGQGDFLIWSQESGALVIGQVTGGAAQYTQIGGLGPEWQFLGVGDYDGLSQAEFLLRNGNSGALVVGTVADNGGTYGVSYAAVGGVGADWNFHTGHIATIA